MGQNLESKITRMEGMNLPQLRFTWKSRLDEEPPALRSGETLKRLLAYKI